MLSNPALNSLPTNAYALFGLGVATFMLWLATLLAVLVVRRARDGDMTTRRAWVASGALTVGVGWWAGGLCTAVAAGAMQLASAPPWPGLLLGLLASIGVAALSITTALRRERWQLIGGAALCTAIVVTLALSAAALSGQALALPAALGFAACMAAAQAALSALLVQWYRQGRPIPLRWSMVAAAAPVAFMLLPMLMWVGAGIAAGVVPQALGTELLVALVALAMMGLSIKAALFQRMILGENRRLNDRLRRAHAELERTPLTDNLTGLANRAGLEALLEAQAARHAAEGGGVTLLFVGLDDFKTLNDSYGHAFGDRVLREVAQRLVKLSANLSANLAQAASRPGSAPTSEVSSELASDTSNQPVARVGGNDFSVLLPGDGERAGAARAADWLLRGLHEPLHIDGLELVLSASVGVACDADGALFSRLPGLAEAAMQAVKQAGGGSYMFFEPRMQEGARERMELLRDLRLAQDANQFELVYQPKIDAATGKVTAAEALLRWRHPTRGMVGPAEFIPIAERAGLIGRIGNWVIEEACRQAKVWRKAGLKMRVAINLSAYQMRQDDLVERIVETLQRYGVSPHRLTCEITESVAMENTQVTQRTFEQLGQAGIHLSIDDFGTGYSSLSYLRQLPASELKIDRSFVMDLASSPDARAIAQAVVQLAHAIGLKVVAEGVETAEQRDILQRMGCDEFQGFLFARPMSARALLMWALDDKSVQQSFNASLFAETREHTVMPTRQELPPRRRSANV